MTNKIDDGLLTDTFEITRCAWCGEDTEYQRYHDTEWGVPIVNDQILFQKICLEGFQAGLSWLTVLRKRDNLRETFDNFDFKKVSQYGDKDISRCLVNPGIIRHRGKIESTINNAKKAIELVNEFGSLASFFWSFEPGMKNRPEKLTYAVASQLTMSTESIALSKALKKRGWTFVGPTICYSFMQAMGIVNDHVLGCSRRDDIETLRDLLIRPNL
jgi:DNA-3-methyladenine glycosylase I